MVNHIVLERCAEGLEVNTEMMIETFILSIDECIPEYLVYLFIFYGCTVLAEELTYHDAVGTIDFGCLSRTRVDNSTHAGRFTKQPQEVDVHSSQIEDDGNNKSGCCRQ